MEVEITKKVKVDAARFYVNAKVRYWEDAEVNGVPDDPDNPTIIGKDGDNWKIIIEIDNGRIMGWEGMEATVYYKVCDEGHYELMDSTGVPLITRDGCYVPKALQIDDNGYGDYICITIDKNGYIKDWNKNCIYDFIKDWEEEQQD